jgi:hypothetical protein
MSPEERAKIARENGAKSKGPKTPEGKAKSSRNAIKSGDHASTLALFVPPHSALLCNEERQQYAALVEENLLAYQPANAPATAAVKAISIAQWEIARLRACITMHWNLALVNSGQSPSDLAPELLEMHAMVNASAILYAPNGIVKSLSRQIDLLELRIARLERRLLFVQKHFATPTAPRPVSEPVEKTEDTQTPAAPEAENEPAIVITENTPSVIEAYKKQYPNARFVILAPDGVALGHEVEDDLPPIPRNVN